MEHNIHREKIDAAIEQSALAELAAYKELHDKIMDRNDKTTRKRFVYFPTYAPRRPGSLTNRNMVALYALLVGILSKRAVIHLPFQAADELYHPQIKCSPQHLPDDLTQQLASCSAFGALKLKLEDLSGWAHPQELLREDYTAGLKQFFSFGCDDLIVFRYPNNRAFHTLFSSINQNHGSYVRSRFGAFLFYYLSNFLFQPSDKIKHLIAPYQSYYQKFTIGVQIRTHYHSRLFSSKPKHAKLYWSAVRSILERRSGNDYSIFLTTDSREVLALGRQEFGANLFHTDFEPRPDGDYVHAVCDQTLLSKCDALVVTDRSTFGYFAHASAGIIPTVVDATIGTIDPQSSSQAGIYTPWPVRPNWPWTIRPRHFATRENLLIMKPFAPKRRSLKYIPLSIIERLRIHVARNFGKRWSFIENWLIR